MGNKLIKNFMNLLLKTVRWPDIEKYENFIESGRTSFLVGVIEKPIITTAVILDSPQIIAAYLVVKIAGMWRGWDLHPKFKEDGEIRKVPGRAFVNIFLVGTAFSVAWGAAGGLIILKYQQHEYWTMFLVPIILYLFTHILYRIELKNYEKEDKARG
ncbi:MAG: hypothetical protein IIA58_03355 [Candidatus Marinimicrobia bacterium]|nr:hypothetical protein [Candidatus Neomarinimicrobiota bacterium]